MVQLEMWRALRYLAVKRSLEESRTVTLKDITVGTFNDLLKKHTKPPVR